ncbi:ABC transporter ATP-binding protein [Anaerolentibacter hominis]|uniref:ABC transporter ATP-binding protein n=1 Tax=Anaerolentibacter hominis TaxID=3079009 RepID=UPI0031B8019E
MQLEARDVGFRYGTKSPWILRHVNLTIHQGERVGLIGPSGFGKSTLAKLLAGFEKPAEGEILLDGKPLPGKGVSPVQLIYQHPEKAINPRWRMRRVLEESGMFKEEVREALGIENEWLERFPRELSGGELQRFCIARSLFDGTRFLLADEMSTMLDVITQAQMWQFILKEAEKRELGMLIITHNRALAERISTRIVEADTLSES